MMLMLNHSNHCTKINVGVNVQIIMHQYLVSVNHVNHHVIYAELKLPNVLIVDKINLQSMSSQIDAIQHAQKEL